MIAALLLALVLGGTPLPVDKPVQAALSMNQVGMKCEVIWPGSVAWYRCELQGVSAAVASDGSLGQVRYTEEVSNSVKSWLLALVSEAVCIDTRCLKQESASAGQTIVSFAR